MFCLRFIIKVEFQLVKLLLTSFVEVSSTNQIKDLEFHLAYEGYF